LHNGFTAIDARPHIMQTIRNFFFATGAILRLAAHTVREIFRLKRDQESRRRAALAFNRIHTYKPLARARWMCPHCNRVHSATGTNPFSGLQFPGCCVFEPGHRMALAHRTGARR
jgi:hypothetical protein